MAAVIVALPVPSNEPVVPVTSPVRDIVLPVARAVAVAALPVAEPAVPLTLPVTLPVRFPVNVPAIAPVPVMVGLEIVGLVANTFAPVPVSSVRAAARFALDGVPRNVAIPVPSAVIPVPPLATGNVPVTPVVTLDLIFSTGTHYR